MKEVNMDREQQKNWKIVRSRTCIRAGLIFLGVLGMQVAMAVILGVFISVRAFLQSENMGEMLRNMNDFYGDVAQYSILLSPMCALASGVWCGILYNRSDWRVRPFDYRRALSLKNLLSIAATAAGLCVLFSAVLGVLQQLLPRAFQNYKQLMETVSQGDMLLSVIYVIIIGPVSEELIFRGALFDRFYLVFPFWWANVLQAVLFGLYHMNIIQGIYAFLLGMILGMIRQMTGSILSTIFCHMVFNATSHALNAIPDMTGRYAGCVLWGLVLFSVIAIYFAGRRIWEICTKNIEKISQN